MFFVNEKKKEGSFTLTEMGALWRDLPVDYKQKYRFSVKKIPSAGRRGQGEIQPGDG